MDQSGSDDRDSPMRWRNTTIQVTLASTLMSVIGVSLISPTLPVVRDTLGITDAQAGLLITVFTLPGIALAPAIGLLADRYGRRQLLVPGLFLYGITGTAIAFTTAFPVVLLLRFLQGIGASGLIVLSLTVIGDHFSGHRRNMVMGWNSAIRSLGAAGGAMGGGFLASYGWNVPFLVYGLSVVVGLVAIRGFEDIELDTTPAGIDHLRDMIRSLPGRRSMLLYGTKFSISLVLFGGVLTAVPFLLSDAFALSSAQIGLLVGGQPLVTALVGSQNGRLARLFDTERLVVLGVALDGLALMTLLLATVPLHVAGSVVVLFGMGQGLLMPSLDTAISGLTGDQYRGSVMSLETSVHTLGQTLGPVLFTSLGVIVGYRPLLAAAGGGVLLGAVGLWVGVRLTKA